MNTKVFAAIALCLSLGLSAASAQQTVSTVSKGNGVCIVPRRIVSTPSTSPATPGTPISTQDMQVQVNCPEVIGADAKSLREQEPETQEPDPVKILGLAIKLLVLIIVLIVTIWLVVLGTRLLSSEKISAAAEGLHVRRHWGGFGGESSGWRVSGALGTCISGVLLLVLATSLAGGTLFLLHKYEEEEEKQAPAEQKSAQTTATPGAGLEIARPAGSVSN